MRPFISLPRKMVFLLLALLLALSAAMSILWLQKTNQDFLLRQQEIRMLNQSQYLLFNRTSRSRIESWVELFVQLNTDSTDQIKALSEAFSERFDYLQLNWQVEELWLFDQNQQIHYGSQSPAPDYAHKYTEIAFEQQRSIEATHCSQQCKQTLSIPILLDDDSLSVVTLSLSLIDTLALLSQSSNSSLALVETGEQQPNLASSMSIRGRVAKKNLQLVDNLIAQLPSTLSVQQLLADGAQVALDEERYFVAIIPINKSLNNQDFILAAHDITPMIKAHERYQWRIVMTALVMFICSLLLFYLMTNSLRKRLNKLSAKLPLLAKRDYRTFQQLSSESQHLFPDELDTLNEVTIALAERLEKLDNEVLSKTQKLEKIAHYDPLTQLPNRHLLLMSLRHALQHLSERDGFVVVFLFDLDDFKKVNDSHGHSVGDELLIEAATRIQHIVAGKDINCRLGGDEFAIMLHHIDDSQRAFDLAEKILDRFRSPINVGNFRFYVSTSVGVALSPSSQVTPAEMLRHADIAMYQAKSQGGNCFRVYDETMSQKAIDKVTLEDEARSALLNDHFSFALQPQIELSTGRLTGFEALLRWEHPERGNVSPGYFIPILENTEFMLSLGYWCIENAFSLLEEFADRGLDDIKIAINLAGIQFLDPDLLPYLDEKIRETGLRSDLIELELTERTLVSDVERTTQVMRNLVDKGFLISIDDFGTGYSSLSYLKTMPANFIKIDRTFIDGMLNSNADKQIVASTIAMVQKLGMQVIAEGIEEQQQIDMLKQFDCDMAQGYYIAKPIPQHLLFEHLAKFCPNKYWQYGSQS